MFDKIMNNLFGTGKNKNNLFRRYGFSNRNANCVYKLVSFEQAKEMIENEKALIIDVRTEGEYDLMHVQNAINIPVNEIEKRIFMYEQTQPIMVYCSSGSRSKNAIIILNRLGYNNIYIWEYGALANFPYKNMLVYNKK